MVLLAWVVDVIVLGLVCWCVPSGNRQITVCFRPAATARVAASHTDNGAGYAVSRTAPVPAPVAAPVLLPHQTALAAHPVPVAGWGGAPRAQSP